MRPLCRRVPNDALVRRRGQVGGGVLRKGEDNDQRRSLAGKGAVKREGKLSSSITRRSPPMRTPKWHTPPPCVGCVLRQRCTTFFFRFLTVGKLVASGEKMLIIEQLPF